MASNHQEQYAASLEAALVVLYGALSRAEAEDISREVQRINGAIERLADSYLSPLDPIVDFKMAMMQFVDSTNTLGTIT